MQHALRAGLLLTSLVSTALPWAVSAAPIVDLQIADTDIRVGELFSVEVLVDGVDPLDEVIAFGFDVDADASWSFSSAEVGSDFNDDSGSFSGTDVAGSVFPGPGPSGDSILLATLSFIGSMPGTFSLGIVSDPLDPNEGLLVFSSLDPFDLTASTPVTIRMGEMPLPATLLLALTGFAGLAVMREWARFLRPSGPFPPDRCRSGR